MTLSKETDTLVSLLVPDFLNEALRKRAERLRSDLAKELGKEAAAVTDDEVKERLAGLMGDAKVYVKVWDEDSGQYLALTPLELSDVGSNLRTFLSEKFGQGEYKVDVRDPIKGHVIAKKSEVVAEGEPRWREMVIMRRVKPQERPPESDKEKEREKELEEKIRRLEEKLELQSKREESDRLLREIHQLREKIDSSSGTANMIAALVQGLAPILSKFFDRPNLADQIKPVIEMQSQIFQQQLQQTTRVYDSILEKAKAPAPPFSDVSMVIDKIVELGQKMGVQFPASQANGLAGAPAPGDKLSQAKGLIGDIRDTAVAVAETVKTIRSGDELLMNAQKALAKTQREFQTLVLTAFQQQSDPKQAALYIADLLDRFLVSHGMINDPTLQQWIKAMRDQPGPTLDLLASVKTPAVLRTEWWEQVKAEFEALLPQLNLSQYLGKSG